MEPSETPCPARKDAQHCVHWWDGEACCHCGDPAMAREQMIAQGMIEEGGSDGPE